MIFTDRYGHKRRGKKYICLTCKTEFIERLVSAQKTKPKYCSRECRDKARIRKIIINCDNCECEFSIKPSRINKSKHGKLFCSRACKDYAQSFLGNCSDIHPPYYDAEHPYDYRRIAFRELPNECADCGIDIRYMLIVHHIDGDRKNNNVTNLEILCHNHHSMRHLILTKNGWTYFPRNLTSSKELKMIMSE